MKQINKIELIKFECNNCEFEFFVNRNNNAIIHYLPSMSVVLEWDCPECGGNLRYSSNNVRFDFFLEKKEKENGPDIQRSSKIS